MIRQSVLERILKEYRQQHLNLQSQAEATLLAAHIIKELWHHSPDPEPVRLVAACDVLNDAIFKSGEPLIIERQNQWTTTLLTAHVPTLRDQVQNISTYSTPLVDILIQGTTRFLRGR